MKTKDVGNSLNYIIQDGNGNTVPLEVSDAVNITLKLNGNISTGKCDIVDYNNAKVSYTIKSGDLPESGTLYTEITLVRANGNVFHGDTKKYRIKKGLSDQ